MPCHSVVGCQLPRASASSRADLVWECPPGWSIVFSITKEEGRGAYYGKLSQQRPKAAGTLELSSLLSPWVGDSRTTTQLPWGGKEFMECLQLPPLYLASHPSDLPRAAQYSCPLSPKLQLTCPSLTRSSSKSPSHDIQLKEVSPALFLEDNSM